MIIQALQEHPQLPLVKLCEVLGVSRSWFYHRQKQSQHAQLIQAEGLGRREADVALRAAIEELVLEFPGYGYRRVTRALARAGYTGNYAVNHKRVLRIMREESLLCQLKRRFIPTTDSNHSFRTYPNLLKEMVLGAPDQAWLRQLGRLTSRTYDCLPTLHTWRRSLMGTLAGA